MSKHALSRIYERYVSRLEFVGNEAGQLSFLSPVPKEVISSKSGSVYTPQYVAGFFARYLRDNTTPRVFRTLRSVDPACGSGIFLRSLLELQCNPLTSGVTLQTIRSAFAQTTGVDRDPSAVQVARLSLALLHLVATGRLPEEIGLHSADAIHEAEQGRLVGPYDAVVANPPFVKLDHLTGPEREAYSQYLGKFKSGRVDAYLAFVKLCLEIVSPGGFVCLVLPQVFLSARNSRPLRERISIDFDIRCVVDLTAIDVFDGVGAYTILLILERRTLSSSQPAKAQVVRVQEFVGPALQACLERRVVDTPYYSVFEVDQGYFQRASWVLLDPGDMQVEARLSVFKPIAEYLEVRQGFLTGADDVFIRQGRLIPVEDRALYREYLKDKQITRYGLPTEVEEVVFYPYEGDRPLSEHDLVERYPDTWAYLLANRSRLEARRSVQKGETLWWRPIRPRDPSRLFRPKIVCPHLMLTPRFGLDLEGKYAVSHTPFLSAREENEEDELVILKFFSAILNSSVAQWHLTTYSPKFKHGYNRVEVASIRDLPVPHPARVRPSDMNAILQLVDAALSDRKAKVQPEIDQLVERIYGLDGSERTFITGLS
jgi:hypothetical protein